MSEEKEQFQSSKTCWICKKLIENDDQKVRDHRHVSEKYIEVQYIGVTT